MNKVKKSLDAVAGDLSEDKERLKQDIRFTQKKKNRKNPFPFISGIAVAAALLLLTLNLLDDKNRLSHDNYQINEVMYNQQLLGESGEQVYRAMALQNILLSDSTIDYAESLGYQENPEAVDKTLKEQKQEFYHTWEKGKEEKINQQQLKHFGISYDEYFEKIHRDTVRYAAADSWLKTHPPKDMKTEREVLETFIEKQSDEISRFMKKKDIHSLETNPPHEEFKGFIGAVEGNEVLVTPAYSRDDVRGKTVNEIIEQSNGAAWFKINEGFEQIKPLMAIAVRFDRLSGPIVNLGETRHYETVFGWRELDE